MNESPDTIHGRMKEGAHIAGYSLQRSIENLRWLLEDSRFEQLSASYKDVNEFLRDSDKAFSLVNIKPEERKQIAELVKELQPKASQRAIADMVGADHATIGADLGTVKRDRSGEISPPDEGSHTESDQLSGEISPPTFPPAIPPDDYDPIGPIQAKQKKTQKAAILQGDLSIEPEVKEIEIRKTEIDIRLGEWYQLGKHRLYCGDTAQPEFYKGLRGDFAFADPPYNAGVAEWDVNFKWKHDWLINVSPVVAVTPGIQSIFDFARITTMPYRWSLSAWIDNGMTRGAIGYGNWIYIALFATESIYRQAQDHVRVSIKADSKNDTNFKGRKPSALMYWIIDTFTKKNQIIIDPFLGSGSTLYAAEKANRICIGGEINIDRCLYIIKTWETMTGIKAKNDGANTI